jgi:hypothetical protein
MTTLFTVIFPVEAEDADAAWRHVRRLFRVLRAEELDRRAHIEEIVGELGGDEELDAEELHPNAEWNR